MPSSTDDQGNPLDMMMPPADNKEYHRKKAEFEEARQEDAAQAVIVQHGHMAERMQRVRKNPPQAQPPEPPARHAAPDQPPQASGGIQVDPSLAETPYTPVEPRLPDELVAPEQATPTEPQAPPAAPPAPPAPPAAPAVPQAPPTAPAVPQVPQDGHPILRRLRQDFGLDQIPLEKVTIGDHVFTMKVLEMASVAQALRFADTLSVSDRENAMMMQVAMVSFAVVAIDGQPLWQVFDTALPDNLTVVVEGERRPTFKPSDPPPSVRMLASTSLMDFLNSEATTGLISELWTAYNDKVDPKGSLESIMDRIGSGEGEAVEDIPLR